MFYRVKQRRRTAYSLPSMRPRAAAVSVSMSARRSLSAHLARQLVVACVVALVAVVLAWPCVACAAGPLRRVGARITWVRGVGAESCVGLLGLEEDIKARLGYDPTVIPSERIIEGLVVRAGTGFRAELVVRDGAGQLLGARQLTGREADCRALGEAVAVAMTVAIDPDATGARGECVATGQPLGCKACPEFVGDCIAGERATDVDGDGCVDGCRTY